LVTKVKQQTTWNVIASFISLQENITSDKWVSQMMCSLPADDIEGIIR
jgi:hypothetical protein